VQARKLLAAWRNFLRRRQDAALGERHSSEAALDRQLAKARKAFLAHMADFRNELGAVELPRDPMLEERHLTSCRLLPYREAILKQMPVGGVVAEIGVETGRFSRAILDICQPSRLHLIDIDLRRFDIRKQFASEIRAGVVCLHEGDSSPIVAGFADRSFDLIYIDGDHTYFGVKRDIEAARTKVKDEGLLVFNDYIYWSPAESMRYGVVRAVNELCLEEDWQIVYFALGAHMYCDVALKRRPSGT
jgi:predicted O-methyltransferase YrrM